MANVTVNGVPYTGVDEVYLPKTGGGEERFTLPPSGTIPITANGTADVSAYQYAAVNVPTGTDTSDATATAADIVGGKTAYIASGKTTGTMTSKSAQTYTPGTSNQTINAGQYLAGTQTIKGDANLVPSNIKNGVSIFGITGNYSGGTTVQTYTGTYTADSSGVAVLNCGFRPDIVFVDFGTYSDGYNTIHAGACIPLFADRTNMIEALAWGDAIGDSSIAQINLLVGNQTDIGCTLYQYCVTNNFDVIPYPGSATQFTAYKFL